MIAKGGSVVAVNALEKTDTTYDQLPAAKKADPTIYVVPESPDQVYQDLSAAKALLGNESLLTECGYSDVCTAIQDLFNRLGGLVMSIDQDEGGENFLKAMYDDDQPSPITPTPIDPDDPEEDQIAQLVALVGDKNDLITTGNTTIAEAIKDLYRKLNGLSFAYVSAKNTISISYDDGT